MDYNIKPLDQAGFDQTLQDLQEFGSKGHERLIVKQNADGSHTIQTAAKGSWSLKGFIVRVLTLNFLRYKPDEKRSTTVARVLCEFMEKNKEFLLPKMLSGKIPPDFMSKFTRLFPDKTSDTATKWFALQSQQTGAYQSQRRQEVEKSIESTQKALEQGHQDIVEKAKKDKTRLVNEGQATKAEMIASAQSDLQKHRDAYQQVNISNPLNPQMKQKLTSLREMDREKGDTVFICQDGKQVRFNLATLSSFYPKSFLEGFAGFKDSTKLTLENAKKLAESQNLQTSSSSSATLDEEVKTKVPSEWKEVDSNIQLTKHYPAETVETLIDLLYGIKNSGDIQELGQLTSLMDLCQELGMEEITAKCKAAASQLLNSNPAKILDAMLLSTTPKITKVVGLNEVGEKIEIEILERPASKDLLELELYRWLEFKPYQRPRMHDPRNYNVIDINVLSSSQKELIFKTLSESPNPNLITLGYCYEHGIGTPKDHSKAFENYQRAADQKDAWGQLNLGRCYQLGIGTRIKNHEAFANYKLAAEQENAFAQLHLGHCYWESIGTYPDKNEAQWNYQQAANQGLPEAISVEEFWGGRPFFK